MGQRANMILVEGGKYHLFYSHWCANTLPRDLFWGPEHAVAFIHIQRPVDDSGWLDDVWAEGGALVDLGRKHFLLYGGEDEARDVPRRRTYLELVAHVWKGWAVRWADEGNADLADYVGYPRERVISQRDQNTTDVTLAPPEQMDWTDLVASVRFADGSVRLYPLAGDVESYLSPGLRLADNISAATGQPRLHLDEWTTEFPSGGFHLDLLAKRLEYWMGGDAPGLATHVARAWPAWETRWHRDRYEAQLERTGGLLRFPLPDRSALLARWRETLLRESAVGGVDTIKRLLEHEGERGKDVQVNPWALRDDRLALSLAERTAILNEVMPRL